MKRWQLTIDIQDKSKQDVLDVLNTIVRELENGEETGGYSHDDGGYDFTIGKISRKEWK